MADQYRYGDKVVFRDYRGKLSVSWIVGTDEADFGEGCVGIASPCGPYIRKAKPWEVRKAKRLGGFLE